MPQFAALVESGKKTQTIRPKPKRAPKPSEEISLREWTGKPYRSKQRELRLARIVSLEAIAIHDDGISLGDGTPRAMWMGARTARHDLLEAFAKADGFTGWQAMRDWFAKQHGLPFEGTLYKWA